MASPRIVPCPACGKPVEWVPGNPYRPFCSARCKGLDLGAWAAEEYRIPGPAAPLPPGSTGGEDGGT
ncbi:MAG: DNA gyrase inhibitor YacG [Rhodocyclaceae bacterium]|nr:DNA gyrase inhibitor YacG [Rhodocyclaceae bacterium]